MSASTDKKPKAPGNDAPCCCPPSEPAPDVLEIAPSPKDCCAPTASAGSNCCPPPSPEAKAGSACCAPEEPTAERPGYRLQPFVTGWIEVAGRQAPQVATSLTWADTAGRWAMRWGLGRERYRVAPGLYAVGTPRAASPVLVTANYKMTFDALRRELTGLDAWVLVLDTKGVNVWCAAGKGTFGTAEVIRRVRESDLGQVVDHRTLILPQLGAPGVAAHEVAKGCGFKVVYGPVRARDIRDYLAADRQATQAMRQVTFSTRERLVLTPVELTGMGRKILWAALILLLLGGIGRDVFSFGAAWSRGGAAILAGLAAVATGAVLTPILLPWLPGRAFALKGALTGVVVAAGGALFLPGRPGGLNLLALLLAVPAVASFCAMNFTGSSTFTSPSGVEKEMRRALPLQTLALLAAGVMWVWAAF
jgi:hypothetical protein